MVAMPSSAVSSSEAAIMTAESPTPPQPITATVSPARSPARAVSARYAVAKRQPRVTTASAGRSSPTGTISAS